MPAPTAFEQMMLELANRIRLDPGAEFDRIISDAGSRTAFASDTTQAIRHFGVNLALLKTELGELTPVQPLAWNDDLAEAATGHSTLMRDLDEQSHQLPGEPDLPARLRAAGYVYTVGGENVFAYTRSPVHGHDGFIVDWGTGPDGMQTPRGHRDNLMSAAFREIGISALADVSAATAVGPWVVTQNFGARSTSGPFLLGVAYNDRDGDGFYSMGEGRSGLRVSVEGRGSPTTGSAGGYALEAGEGVARVTLSGGPAAETIVADVTIARDSVKLDLVDGRRVLTSGDLTLVRGAAEVVALGVGDISLRGAAEAETLIGNAGDNRIDGEDGNDYAAGEAGHDDIHGGAGRDRIYGGSGEDRLCGDRDNDRLSGGDGNDGLNGGDGNDLLYGSAGNDYAYGEAGDDAIRGGTGRDRLYGDAGDDSLWGEEEDDRLSGGDGNDELHGGDGNDLLYGSAGNDFAYGEAGDDAIRGGTGRDRLYGDAGNDRMWGEEEDDRLSGGDGNDELHGGDGNDLLYGSAGNDFAYGEAGDDAIRGGTGRDRLYGDAGDDSLWGDEEDDRLSGGDGNDELHGGDGNDLLYGSAGNDRAYGGSGNDVIRGETGADWIQGGAGDDSLWGGSGADVFVFGRGDGRDVIGDFASTDSIHLLGGLTAQGVEMTRAGADALLAFDGTTVVVLGGAGLHLDDLIA